MVLEFCTAHEVPSVVRAYAPEVIFSQCGCDSHRLDPLADLRLSVDGQRAAHLAIRDLAEELCGGRWIATGFGFNEDDNSKILDAETGEVAQKLPIDTKSLRPEPV